MPTRNQVNESIDALITPDGADKVTAAEHREANGEMLDYVDQQDTAIAATVTALSSSTTTALAGKQATLVSGTNIKTVNGTSLLGAGNLVIAGGGGSGTWGAIAGTITDQTDLQTALATKQDDLTASGFADLLEDGLSDAGNIAFTRVGNLHRADLAWNGVWTDPDAIPDVDGATLTKGRAEELFSPLGGAVELVGTAINLNTATQYWQEITGGESYTVTGGEEGVTNGYLLLFKNGTGDVEFNGDVKPTRDNDSTVISIMTTPADFPTPYHISSDYAEGVSLTTPAAPTSPLTDDTANEFDWTNTVGYSAPGDYEVNINGAGYTDVTTKPIVIGDINVSIGGLSLRVKAVPGVSNASAPLTNAVAFTSSLPSLAAPTFAVSDISDTEIDLTSITADGDATSMVIQRATNSGMSTGLTTVHSGAIVTSFSDTGLTPSTTYYYRITVSETGYTNGVSTVMSDTTQAGGSGFPVIENFDAIANGSIPAGFTADAGVEVQTTAINVSPGKTLQFPRGGTNSKIHYNTISPSADCYIQDDFRNDEAGYFEYNAILRANNQAWDNTSNGYLCAFIMGGAGAGFSVYRRTGATITNIASPVGGGTTSTGEFYRRRFEIIGTTITVEVERLSDGLFLDSGSNWVTGPVNCISVTDSAHTGAGYYGRTATVSGTGAAQNYTDNLELG